MGLVLGPLGGRFLRHIGPPPLRGSFFLENGTLRETREKKIFPIQGQSGISEGTFRILDFYSNCFFLAKCVTTEEEERGKGGKRVPFIDLRAP